MEPVKAREHAITRSRKRSGSSNWRNIKVKKSTYDLITKLSKMLGLSKHKVVDTMTLVFTLLISEKITMSQDDVNETLAQCVERYDYDEETNYASAELNPICVLKKVLLPFYRRHKLLENLVQNIEDLVLS